MAHTSSNGAVIVVSVLLAASAVDTQPIREVFVICQPTLVREDGGPLGEAIPCGAQRRYFTPYFGEARLRRAGGAVGETFGGTFVANSVIRVYEFDGFPLAQKSDLIAQNSTYDTYMGFIGVDPIAPGSQNDEDIIRYQLGGQDVGGIFDSILLFCRDNGADECAFGGLVILEDLQSFDAFDPDPDPLSAIYVEIEQVNFLTGGAFESLGPIGGAYQSILYTVRCEQPLPGFLLNGLEVIAKWNIENISELNLQLEANNVAASFDSAMIPLNVERSDITVTGVASDPCAEIGIIVIGGTPQLQITGARDCDMPLPITLTLQRTGARAPDGQRLTLSADTAGAMILSPSGQRITLVSAPIDAQAITPADHPAVIDEQLITITPITTGGQTVARLTGAPGAVRADFDALLTRPLFDVSVLRPPALGQLRASPIAVGSAVVQPDGSFAAELIGDDASFTTDAVLSLALRDQFGSASTTLTCPLPEYCPGDLNRDGDKDAFDVGDALDLVSQECPTR